MTCPRCKAAMREEKRTFHKQRKWICPECGRIRFQKLTTSRRTKKE
jgi:transposase-like protein